MKRLSLAIAIAPLALAGLSPLPAFAQGAPSADAKAIFAARYADLRAAMDKGEADPILAILTPDFSATGRNGQTRTADDVVSMAARMQMMGDPSARKTNITIDSATITGDGADVEQTTDTSMTRNGRDGQTHTIEITSTSDDHWVNQNGVWRLQKQTPKSTVFKRDGVEMKPGERGPGGGRGGRRGADGPPPPPPPQGDAGAPPPPPPGDDGN